jgi:hypothetical protein
MAESRNKLTRNQKLSLAGLTVFGVLIVVFWAISLNNQIRAPLLFKVAADNQSAPSAAADEEKLKTQDTDGDGLSDWDEKNVYFTSAYLADSDSDGIPDGVEVKNSTDPNCPQGKICNAPAAVPPALVASSSSAAGSLPENLFIDTGSASGTDAELNKILTCQDMAVLRKYLLDSGGINQQALDKLSDADLQQMCEQQARQNAQ